MWWLSVLNRRQRHPLGFLTVYSTFLSDGVQPTEHLSVFPPCCSSHSMEHKPLHAVFSPMKTERKYRSQVYWSARTLTVSQVGRIRKDKEQSWVQDVWFMLHKQHAAWVCALITCICQACQQSVTSQIGAFVITTDIHAEHVSCSWETIWFYY